MSRARVAHRPCTMVHADPAIDLSRAHIERKIQAFAANSMRRIGSRRSAVACILRYERAAPDVLLMKRAERPGDRWSGQVSFPGGREEDTDPELRATAIRETREEVGVDLQANSRFIGRLDTIRARAKGGFLPLTVTPFVFVKERPFDLQLNREADAAFWLPLDQVAAGELASEYRYKVGPAVMKLPSWRYREHVVWGLTHKMLNHLLDVIRS